MMSLADIRPEDVPPDLRARIEIVMRRRRLSWAEAVVFLAEKVVAPRKAKSRKE